MRSSLPLLSVHSDYRIADVRLPRPAIFFRSSTDVTRCDTDHKFGDPFHFTGPLTLLHVIIEQTFIPKSCRPVVSMIRAPYTIARLPEAPFPDEARIQCADVHSVSGIRTRRRSELAIAIDRTCINLYDVNSIGSAGRIGF